MRTLTAMLALVALIASSLSTTAEAQQPNITFGVNNEIELIENTANQRIDFSANNVAGRNFDTFEMFILIGDGGEVLGGSDTGPGLSGVELGQAGTLFENGARGMFDAGSQTPLLWADFIDSVVATDDGVLGTLIFDTTGVSAGNSLAIQFGGFSFGGNDFDSNFRNDAITENVSASSGGVITVVSAVPEPSSVICILALTGLVGLRRHR